MTTATAERTGSTTWTIDPAHSSVEFAVRHLMITTVRGRFTGVTGTLVTDDRDPAKSAVDVVIDAATIDTREPQRDAHLKSADFFDAESHPQMVFESRAVRAKGDGYELVGDLTIRGTTREVVLSVDDVTAEHTDPWGNKRIGASAHGKIRRSEFGMTWNTALEAGGVLVSDEVKIHIEASLIKQA